MGIVSISLSQNNNMKFLLVVAVAAYVKAEADPAFVYSTGGVLPYAHGVLPYAHALHTPLVYAAPLAAGCQNDQGKLVPCAHGALPLVAPVAAAAAPAEEAVESVAKREAEPTAEADAELTPRPTHGCCTADTTDMLMDTTLHSPTHTLHTSTPTPTPTMDSHTPTMARDPLMLSQSQRLRLMLMLTMDTMDMD